MKVTNKAGLPGAIVEAVKNDDYDPGKADISCTTLIAPPRQRVLRKAHDGELVEDASDRIYALLGQSMHTILERAEPSALVEKRLYMKMGGWTISGQFDRISIRQVTLQDYKLSSVWEYMYGLKPDRIAQLNVLAELAHQNGMEDISKLEVVMIFRDWQKSQAKFKKEYPQHQVARLPVPLWDKERRLAYIAERVKVHQDAEKGVVVDCTDDERWLRDEAWAVMKQGRKSALKVEPTKVDAERWVLKNGYAATVSDEEIALNDDISIIHRPGVNTRCEAYCNVAQFCSQFKKITG